jgi:hypothetical protein
MIRDDVFARMADYLDGLLEGEEAEAARAEIARHPDVLAEVARMRAILYRPYAVPPPDADQPARILARYRDRPLLRALRYAAVFAAGVASALLLPAAPEEHTPAVREAPAESAPMPVYNRRIH